METFGNAFADIRVNRGLTQGDIAAILGVRVSYISDVERSRKKPFAPDNLQKLYRAMKCSSVEKAQLDKLAVCERQIVEIPFSKENPKANELAYALARSISSGQLSDSDLDELLEKFRG